MARLRALQPRMLEKYLAIFRSVNNFVYGGTDGKTPAMRLSFARQPLRFEDILWPGERVPRLKRSRRKGRAIPAYMTGKRVSGIDHLP